MNAAEKYLFEVHGYLVIEGVLTPDEVAAANAAIDAHADGIGIRPNALAHESQTLQGTQGRGACVRLCGVMVEVATRCCGCWSLRSGCVGVMDDSDGRAARE